ncbi:SU10 major capsid protein [Fusobacterium nucleatum]|uniref:SU10 major capsid protein n=1 Tax=Fusobacterium nucleatum TaxID=851 RepID=UPI0030D4D124
MAKIDNQLSSTNQVISNDILDELQLVNPNNSPIISHVLRGGRTSETTSTTIEWIDHYERKVTSSLKVALNAGVTEIQVVDEDILVQDALLSIGDEIVKITKVKTDNKADVIRGYAGTTSTAGTIVANTIVQSLGIEMEEGGELKKSSVRLPVHITNNTGIIYEEYEVTETTKHLNPHGQSGLSVREVESQKKKDEMLGIMENKLLNGVKYVNGKIRMSGGIKSLIKEHGIVLDANNQPFTLDLLDNAVKAIVDKGNPGSANLKANKYFLCVPYLILRTINKLNKDNVRSNITDKVTGTTIEQIVTTSGTVSVFPATSLAPNEFLLINLNDVSLRQLYSIKEEVGAKTALADNYFLHGEYAHQIKNLPFQVHVKNVKI